MASQGLWDLLAVAITLPRPPEDGRPNPGPNPPDEPRQSALGAPRMHGELFKLAIEVSQATIGGYLPQRRKAPSPCTSLDR
jgi:hypothetical protein